MKTETLIVAIILFFLNFWFGYYCGYKKGVGDWWCKICKHKRGKP